MFSRTESFSQFIRLYPIVSTLVGLHLFIFILIKLQIFPAGVAVEQFAGVNVLIAQGEYWRLLTPIFLHIGFSHMLFNSFSLVLFGPSLERALGKTIFIVSYLLSGVGANIVTLILKPPYYTHLGASGAIFGLFGIYLAILAFKKGAMPQEGKQVIIPMAALGFIMSFIQPNVNATAHIAGLACGFGIGFLITKWRRIHF